MPCDLVSCPREELLIQSLSSNKFMKSIWANKDLCFAFVDLEKAFDYVPWKELWWVWGNLGSKNGSLELSKFCTQMQNLVYKSMISIVLGLISKLDYIRVLSSACFYLSLWWKNYHAISRLVVLGNSFKWMTKLWLQKQ